MFNMFAIFKNKRFKLTISKDITIMYLELLE